MRGTGACSYKAETVKQACGCILSIMRRAMQCLGQAAKVLRGQMTNAAGGSVKQSLAANSSDLPTVWQTF